MEVWKDPDCGCCKDCVAIPEKSGFSVRVFESGNEAIRTQLGKPAKLGSSKRTLFAVNDAEIKTYRTQQDKPVGVCELRPSAQGSA
ncbi:hypothetical protein [Limnohabitans sp. Rim8]|uniref:hypothetical protein n=1 Tax=Limnohabitans sp. Rim8 TaxID=1100718 RepID=UPI002620FEA3|nr:hypothetical protein [Limnohabitans sp. Rim8]